MQPFTVLQSPALTLPLANIDTDQLIPARFMKRPRSEGYGAFLLHDLRHGDSRIDMAAKFDDPASKGAGILISRRNFGCGSSREAAVYALVDFGIRCVIAPSFGDIFASNSIKNGLLPAIATEEEVEKLLSYGDRTLTIDLAAQTISSTDAAICFMIDASWKEQLLNGWDDIDLTRARKCAIDKWRQADMARRPWVSL